MSNPQNLNRFSYVLNNPLRYTDPSGNIVTKNGSISYTYDSNHKHAVSTISAGGTYTYDANGNTLAPGASAGVTCRVEGGITYKQEYNVENQLTAVKKMNGTCTGGSVLETTSFIYDGDGRRVA